MNSIIGINQLRAISVLLVFLFHAEIIYGGFIGVDIFFVISGFLIGSSIQRLKSKKTPALKVFYSRRILRLFPALLAVMVVTFFLNFVIINDHSRIFVNRSAISALFFSSNIYDSFFSDYFATSAAYNPYSHLWSLGIEEQFYLVIAPIIIFLKRFRFLLILMMLISLFSFILSSKDASIVYYFPLYRIWELFAGVILSLYLFKKQFKKSKYNQLINTLVIIIFFTIAIYGFQPDFFTIWKIQTLIVVILSLIFIYNCPFKIDSIIIHNLMDWIGKLSYGIYLIHLPIIVYSRWLFGYLDIYLVLVSFLITLFLAHYMNKYLENYFWKPSN